MEVFKNIMTVVQGITAVITLLTLFIKPIRKKVFGVILDVESIKEGLRCVLRDRITAIYYKNLDNKTLREYEFQNLEKAYAGYKALDGNSFVDHIYEEMMEWSIAR